MFHQVSWKYHILISEAWYPWLAMLVHNLKFYCQLNICWICFGQHSRYRGCPVLLSGAWTMSTSRLNVDWVFCFRSGISSRFQIHMQFLQTMGSYRFSIWIFGCPGLVHPLLPSFCIWIFAFSYGFCNVNIFLIFSLEFAFLVVSC